MSDIVALVPAIYELYLALRPRLRREFPPIAWPRLIENDFDRTRKLMEHAERMLQERRKHDETERAVVDWLNLVRLTESYS